MEIAKVDQIRKQRFAFVSVSFVLIASVIFAVVDFIEQEKMEFLADILVIVFLSAGLIMLKKSDRHIWVYRVALAFLSAAFLYNTVIGAGNGTAIYWLFSFPVVFMFFLGRKEGGIVSAVFFCILCLLLINPFSFNIYKYDLSVSLRFLASFLLVTFIAYGLETSRENFGSLLIENHAKLLNEKQHLQLALNEIKTLHGLIPICCSCKKIRNDEGYWQQVEVYISDHTHADFSHGLCPDCAEKLYRNIKVSGSETAHREITVS